VDRGATPSELAGRVAAVEPTGLGKQQNKRPTLRPTRQPAAGEITVVAAQFRAELVAFLVGQLPLLAPRSKCSDNGRCATAPFVSRPADRSGDAEDVALAKWIPGQLDPSESVLGVKRVSTRQLCDAQASPISTS
jgi:hypothetical protein